MYNFTNGSEQAVWKTRVNGFINRTLDFFFLNGTMVERPCELPDTNSCDTDQQSFKVYMHRWLATVTQVAPFTAETILPVLKTSTAGAVSSCTGGANGRACGFRWNIGGFDSHPGAGEQMSVLAALSSLLVSYEAAIPAPLTNSTGGTSQGNPAAGEDDVLKPLPPPTSGDKAGASILTIVTIVSLTSFFAWMGIGI